MPDGSATAHLYFPKLATVLTEGYGFGALRKDIFAGLTVAIVALPFRWRLRSLPAFRRNGASIPRSLAAFWCRRWGQSVSDRRTGRRFHRAGRGDSCEVRR